MTILNICKRDDNFGASGLGNTAQVKFLDSSNCDNSGLNEVLQCKVINASRTENDVCARVDDHLTSLFADVHFLLTDLIKLLGILAKDLNAHLEAEFVEVEVNTSDLAVLKHLWHALRAAGGLNSVTIN